MRCAVVLSLQLTSSNGVLALVSMLYAWVEELRVDVARRGCKVVPSEIHVLSDSVAALARGLLDLQSEPCGSRGGGGGEGRGV